MFVSFAGRTHITFVFIHGMAVDGSAKTRVLLQFSLKHPNYCRMLFVQSSSTIAFSSTNIPILDERPFFPHESVSQISSIAYHTYTPTK
jgi:hypothetical protein